MSCYFYILFSTSKDKNYLGYTCDSLEERMCITNASKKIFDTYYPKIIVLADPEQQGGHKTERIRNLIRYISDYAQKQKIQVY